MRGSSPGGVSPAVQSSYDCVRAQEPEFPGGRNERNKARRNHAPHPLHADGLRLLRPGIGPGPGRGDFVAAPGGYDRTTCGTLIAPVAGGCDRAEDGCYWPGREHGLFVDHNNFVCVSGNGTNLTGQFPWAATFGDDSHILKFTAEGEFVYQMGHAGMDGPDSENIDRGPNGTPQPSLVADSSGTFPSRRRATQTAPPRRRHSQRIQGRHACTLGISPTAPSTSSTAKTPMSSTGSAGPGGRSANSTGFISWPPIRRATSIPARWTRARESSGLFGTAPRVAPETAAPK